MHACLLTLSGHCDSQVADSKGNSVAYPKAVLGLPFSDEGNSYFFSNEYEMQCKTGNQGTTGGGKVSIHCSGLLSWCNNAVG